MYSTREAGLCFGKKELCRNDFSSTCSKGDSHMAQCKKRRLGRLFCKLSPRAAKLLSCIVRRPLMTAAHRLSLERKFSPQESLKYRQTNKASCFPSCLGWLITDAWLFSFLQPFCVSHQLVLTEMGLCTSPFIL